MSKDIDLIYDDLMTAEKLKKGTKYERLAAVVFRQITGEQTVHDLRLVGGSGVAHQIDAVVGEPRRRLLIEVKDYDKKIGLPIIRNFWGAVDDIRPDEAYVLSIEGFTKPASQFAEAKGIRLAILRPPRDEDWDKLVRQVALRLTMTGQTGPPTLEWQLHPADQDKIAGTSTQSGLMATAELELSDQQGQRRPLLPILEEQMHEEYGKVPLGGKATIGRLNILHEPTWLHAPDLPALRVDAWKWTMHVASSTTEHTIDNAVGELAAALVLRSVDGAMRRMITRGEIESWTFDGKRVVERASS